MKLILFFDVLFKPSQEVLLVYEYVSVLHLLSARNFLQMRASILIVLVEISEEKTKEQYTFLINNY